MNKTKKLYKYNKICNVCKKAFKSNYIKQINCSKECGKKSNRYNKKTNDFKKNILDFMINYIENKTYFRTNEISTEYIRLKNVKLNFFIGNNVKLTQEFKKINGCIAGYIIFLRHEKVLEKYSTFTYISNKKVIDKLKELKDKSISRKHFYRKMDNVEKTFNRINRGINHMKFLNISGKLDCNFKRLYNSFFVINPNPIKKTVKSEKRYIRFLDITSYLLPDLTVN